MEIKAIKTEVPRGSLLGFTMWKVLIASCANQCQGESRLELIKYNADKVANIISLRMRGY